jgi:hypothetical protein
LSLDFLIETKIYSQNLEIKAPKGLRAIGFSQSDKKAMKQLQLLSNVLAAI